MLTQRHYSMWIAMIKRYDVYLALGMHGRTVGEVLLQTSLAKSFCTQYGLSYYSPADDEGLEGLPLSHIIDLKPNMATMCGYVEKDEKHLSQCRSLLVLTGDKCSSGTMWEQALAFYKLKIPIILVAPKMAQGKLVNFTTVKADFITHTQEEAIQLIAGGILYAVSTKRR